jgi:hypothetical protein
VSGDFYCSYNNLSSLEGAPSSVSGDFYCYNNNLSSLEGAPSSVSGNFICFGNKISKEEEAEYRKFLTLPDEVKKKIRGLGSKEDQRDMRELLDI